MKNTVDRNWYKEFAQISTRMEGTIRCSYLALFDAEDNFLFSIQGRYHKTVRDTRPNERGNFVDNSGVEYTWNSVLESDGQVAAQFALNEWCTLNKNGQIEAKEAVVIANEFVDSEKVPVRLTESARLACLAIVQRQLDRIAVRTAKERTRDIQDLLDAGWSKSKIEEAEVNGEKWYYIPGSYVYDQDITVYRYAKKFLPMLQNKDSIYYIYWWQCRWYPTNVMNSQVELEEVEKKYLATERLAKLLAAASGITLFT